MTEAERLENLWRGRFGDEDADRNAALDDRRSGYWRGLLGRHPIQTVLEANQDLQEAVLTAYHLMTIFFEQTAAAAKLLWSSHGRTWMKHWVPAGAILATWERRQEGIVGTRLGQRDCVDPADRGIAARSGPGRPSSVLLTCCIRQSLRSGPLPAGGPAGGRQVGEPLT